MSLKQEKIGIVGSGLIGRSWAMLFAGVGYQVSIYDIEPKQVETALTEIEKQLNQLQSEGLLRGDLNANQQYACIKGTSSLKEAVQGAFFVQECVPEDLQLKQNAWKSIDRVVDPNTILSSSTSTHVPSSFSETLQHRENIIVSHPVNPPYYVPLVEIVPAPWTRPSVVTKTRALMEEIGQSPVTLSREIPGFALNRLQYAILNEAWNLVEEGVMDAKDVDKVMSDGLGWRYAFIGPLETAYLNADGFVDYCNKYAQTIYSTSMTFKPVPKFVGPQVRELQDQLQRMVPMDTLPERRNWRDKCLTKLAALKKIINAK